uniref:Uncharacterized protein n=1 Tax=Romanomermis culicivorax TaxID=13658 RepID=A0A915JNW5_ROMCU
MTLLVHELTLLVHTHRIYDDSGFTRTRARFMQDLMMTKKFRLLITTRKLIDLMMTKKSYILILLDISVYFQIW